MIFETKRLILRPWSESDAADLYKYAKDPSVGPVAGWPVHRSEEDSRYIINNILSADETYAVCLKEDNKAIGSIGLIKPAASHVKIAEDELELGFWIGVPFWGKGLIPEAVSRILDHAFNDLSCSAVWCGYYEGNTKSKRCQEKCGFKYHHTEENKPCILMGDIRTEHISILTREDWSSGKERTVVLYIHGKGGSPDEAAHFAPLFPDAEIYGFDYRSETPWDAVTEFSEKARDLAGSYEKVILVAQSIGFFFSMNAGIDRYIDKAYLISPIVDLEKLIKDMMSWAGVSEAELEEKKIIPVDFGDDLSWEYLQYVRSRNLSWSAPTEILYGSLDNLQSLDTINEFAARASAGVNVMEGGEHWFHTEEQLAFLDNWLRRKSIRTVPSDLDAPEPYHTSRP